MSGVLEFLNWASLFVALSGMALLLRALSRRLGEALRMKKYYLLYDASIALMALSLILIISGLFSGLLSRLLFLSGAVLMVGTTMRYWWWIVPEIFKPGQ
ncbi:hypothetical protein Mtc_1242 [Methanocella conradii HZ254]|uniref:Uncharacterized protein n=1 Tax=Methanocella conradii (strain DSM 24694 / JCM 17849 / CGMCC 1.5162 / HZ254) TaxID=1041930 RepID=H8I8U1_METCZ|nr:hypothetical protein [Methanocella conradii]AFC99995.1 hypothetical protein Mtc_1242 [Methanocella conradii HZ254]